MHQKKMESQAEYFSSYWGIINEDNNESFYDLDETFQNEIIQLYKEIYSLTKYEVCTPEKRENGEYIAEVKVYPINVMTLANRASYTYQPLQDFIFEYTTDELASMSAEEYAAYTLEYGRIILQLVQERLEYAKPMEEKSVLMRLNLDDEMVLTLNEDDYANFDNFFIYYP
ncbi:MAG: hypothetical protein U0L05_00125 [Schaedlerella sp.]|nr:hypothetical protein [Schaedlerella sp.]